MAQIVIKCPTTGKLVPTGIAMDKASFASSTLTGNSFRCSACGKAHTWDKKDAQLQPDS